MQRSHPFASVAVAVAVALAVLAGIGLLSRRGTEPQPQPTPPPGIRFVATDVRTVPKVPGPRKRQIVTELGRTLVRLYRTAFVATDTNASPEPEDKVQPFFTRAARTALVRDRDVFRLQRGLEISSGRVAFSGVVTIDGNTPIQALFDVDFLAVALPPRGSPEVRVHQQGTMSLVRVDRRWYIDGFDLRFATKPIPTPTPGDS